MQLYNVERKALARLMLGKHEFEVKINCLFNQDYVSVAQTLQIICSTKSIIPLLPFAVTLHYFIYLTSITVPVAHASPHSSMGKVVSSSIMSPAQQSAYSDFCNFDLISFHFIRQIRSMQSLKLLNNESISSLSIDLRV